MACGDLRGCFFGGPLERGVCNGTKSVWGSDSGAKRFDGRDGIRASEAFRDLPFFADGYGGGDDTDWNVCDGDGGDGG